MCLEIVEVMSLLFVCLETHSDNSNRRFGPLNCFSLMLRSKTCDLDLGTVNLSEWTKKRIFQSYPYERYYKYLMVTSN